MLAAGTTWMTDHAASVNPFIRYPDKGAPDDGVASINALDGSEKRAVGRTFIRSGAAARARLAGPLYTYINAPDGGEKARSVELPRSTPV